MPNVEDINNPRKREGVRKINKIDEFYKKKVTLGEVKRKLKHYALYCVEVSESSAHIQLDIKFLDVFQSIDKKHLTEIPWGLKRMLEDIQKELSAKIVEELEEELEGLKKDIQEDFDLGGDKKDD